MTFCNSIPFKQILYGFTRLTGLAFVIIAGFSIPETLKLLEESYEQVGSTLYVPLLICEPREIEVGGQSIAFNSTETVDVGNCRSMAPMVQLVVLSLAFSMAAMVFFFIFDALATKKIGPFGKGSVLGMGLFLIFILIQSAICTMGVARECLYWTKYFTKIYDEDGLDVAYGTKNVQTYGNSTMLFATSGVAYLASLLLFVEAFVKACSRVGRDHDSSDGGATARTSTATSSTRSSATKKSKKEKQDNTESSNLSEELGLTPTVDVAPARPSYTNPDQPSWLTPSS